MTIEKDSLLDAYFKEIKKYPLLTQEEEIMLAKKVKKGCQESRDRLITGNLRIVVKIAKKYHSMNCATDFYDIIGFGNEGLIKAVGKFNPKKGRFTTYAVWWIKQSIVQRLVENANTIRIPTHARAYHKQCLQLMEKENISFEEACLFVGISTDDFNMVEKVLNPSSLDSVASIDGDEGSPLVELKSDYRYEHEERILDECEAEYILELMNKKLDSRHRTIIMRRLEKKVRDESGKLVNTLENIGDDLGVTKERVRQMEQKANEDMQKIIIRRREMEEEKHKKFCLSYCID